MSGVELLMLVKEAVARISPSAEVILYGSRARNTAAVDSDWDILVVTHGKTDASLKNDIRKNLYEIEWESGEVISTIIKSQSEWDLLKFTPFHLNIDQEGILL